jgi:hypothetical protein
MLTSPLVFSFARGAHTAQGILDEDGPYGVML